MYKILFIDEEQESLTDFEEYIEKFNNDTQFELITTLPLSKVEEMIEEIIKINPDALIVDFFLNEKKIDIDYVVKYNGAELVQEFQKMREKFPCFVLTARDTDAVNASEDVNIVYTKYLLHGEENDKEKGTFANRILQQIKHYKSRVEDAKNELERLLEIRRSGNADIKIENKIIELDDFLEKSIDAKNSIPKEFKILSNSSKLDNILDKVTEMLQKIENDGK